MAILPFKLNVVFFLTFLQLFCQVDEVFHASFEMISRRWEEIAWVDQVEMIRKTLWEGIENAHNFCSIETRLETFTSPVQFKTSC